MAGLDLETFEMVAVEWADAYVEENTWCFLHDIEDKGEYIVATVGWLLKAGEGGQTGHVSVAQSLGARDGAVDNVIHIPAGMVRSLRSLTGDRVSLLEMFRRRQ